MNVYFLCNHAVIKKLCGKPKIKIYCRANGNKGREEGDAADGCQHKKSCEFLWTRSASNIEVEAGNCLDWWKKNWIFPLGVFVYAILWVESVGR